MKAICDKYKFGKLSKNEFRYCGREVKKDAQGVVKCPIAWLTVCVPFV